MLWCNMWYITKLIRKGVMVGQKYAGHNKFSCHIPIQGVIEFPLAEDHEGYWIPWRRKTHAYPMPKNN